MTYLFQSERLGFREWTEADLPDFQRMNADEAVMRHFPNTLTLDQTKRLMDRMQQMFQEQGYCYYAVDRLEDQSFIGFIGLAWQTYPADFTPCTDIGWRLLPSAWGQGYATEGAKKCLQQAFEVLGITTVKSVATLSNANSIKVMEKIGMHKVGTFVHPRLLDYPQLKTCVLYEINAPGI